MKKHEDALKKAKETIIICGSDESVNKDLLALIQRPMDQDCFGMQFLEETEECQKCVVLAELDGRRESLFVFCKELTGLRTPKEKEEKKEKKEVKDEEFVETLAEKPEKSKKSKPEVPEKEEVMAEGATARKRYTEAEINAIVTLKNSGKSFEEVQSEIKTQFNIERPIGALKIIYNRHTAKKE